MTQCYVSVPVLEKHDIVITQVIESELSIVYCSRFHQKRIVLRAMSSSSAKSDEVEVRRCDQESINEFGRLNTRVNELKSDRKRGATRKRP